MGVGRDVGRDATKEGRGVSEKEGGDDVKFVWEVCEVGVERGETAELESTKLPSDVRELIMRVRTRAQESISFTPGDEVTRCGLKRLGRMGEESGELYNKRGRALLRTIRPR